MKTILLNSYKYNSGIISRFLFSKISKIIKDKFIINKVYLLSAYLFFGLLGSIFGLFGIKIWFSFFIYTYIFLNVFVWKVLTDEKDLAEYYYFRRYEQIIRDFLDVLIIGCVIIYGFNLSGSLAVIVWGILVILLNYLLDYVGIINLLMTPKSLEKDIIIELDKKYFLSLQTMPFGRDILFLVLGTGLFFISIGELFIILVLLGIILFASQNYYFLKNIEKKEGKCSFQSADSSKEFQAQKVSLDEIKKQAVKSKEGFYAYYNNLLALRFVPWFHKKNITPNQVTLLGFIFAVFSMFCFCVPIYIFWIIGSLFIILSFMLDGVDGTLARWTGQTSYFGGWLDRVLDRTADILIVFGIGIGQYFYTNNIYMLDLAFLAILGQIIYCRAYDSLVIGGYLTEKYPKLKTHKIYKWFYDKNFLLGFRRDMCFFTIIICSILNKLSLALFIIIIGQLIEWVIRSYGLYKRRSA